MEATISLILGTIVVLVISYFVLIALINLFKKLIDHSRGALKSIFVILGVVAIGWIIYHNENSDDILFLVKQLVFQ